MILTFDLDGVIADRSHLPADARTEEYFINKTLLEPDVNKYIAKLSKDHVIYIITSRKTEIYPVTARWLDKQGISKYISGLICAGSYQEKADIMRPYHCHFDDDPRVFDSYTLGMNFGYLVDNPDWDLNQNDNYYKRVMNWQEIMKVCSKL